MRNGDFSRLLVIDPVRYQVYDPLSTQADPARPGFFVRTPSPGNIIFAIADHASVTLLQRADAGAEQPPRIRRGSRQQLPGGSMPNNVAYHSWNNRSTIGTTTSTGSSSWMKTHFIEDAQDYTFETEPGHGLERAAARDERRGGPRPTR